MCPVICSTRSCLVPASGSNFQTTSQSIRKLNFNVPLQIRNVNEYLYEAQSLTQMYPMFKLLAGNLPIKVASLPFQLECVCVAM